MSIWSYLEAVAKIILREENVERHTHSVPISLLKDLTSFGQLTQDEYTRLKRVASLRNAAAHGYPNVSIDDQAFDDLIEVVEVLADRGGKGGDNV